MYVGGEEQFTVFWEALEFSYLKISENQKKKDIIRYVFLYSPLTTPLPFNFFIMTP